MTNRKGKVRTRPGSVNAAMTPLRPGRDPSGGTGNGTATTSCPHETQEQTCSYMKPCGLRRVSDLLLLTRPTAPQPPASCARARRAAVRTTSERKAQARARRRPRTPPSALPLPLGPSRRYLLSLRVQRRQPQAGAAPRVHEVTARQLEVQFRQILDTNLNIFPREKNKKKCNFD